MAGAAVNDADKKAIEAAKKRIVLPFKMEMPEEYSETTRIKALIYGESGVGKTTLAGTSQDVPEMKNAINIDAESGHKVLSYRGDIPRIRVSNYHGLANVFEFFKKYVAARDANNTEVLIEMEAMARRVDKETIKEPQIFNTLILDSLTELQKMCMYQILSIDLNNQRLDMTPESPEWQDWGQSYEMIQLLMRRFRDLDMNVIFVAGAQRDQDDRKRMVYQPMLPGKLSTGILYYVDHVGFMHTMKSETGGIIRRLYLSAAGSTYLAKNRFRNFKDSYMDDPTMAKLYALEKQ